MNKILKILGFNAAILLAGIIVLELVFGGWFTDSDPMLSFARPKNVQWSYKTPWEPDGAAYSRDRFGLRGLDGLPRDIYILTVGGSTTDQRYLSTDKTWQEILQSKLERSGGTFDVVNAGIDGQSTVGHIKNFSQWFNRIEELQPKYVLFYIGVNDFYIGDDNIWDANLEKNNTFKSIISKSALVAAGRIVRDIVRNRTRDAVVDQKPGHSFDGIDTSGYVAGRNLTRCCDDSYLVDSMAGLRRRVKELARLTGELGARAIFVNQRSALWTRREIGIHGAPALRYAHPSTLKNLGEITGVDRHDIEAFQARTIMEACRESDAICIDFLNEIRFDVETDFYDPIHNTPKGAEVIGRYLHDKLKHAAAMDDRS